MTPGCTPGWKEARSILCVRLDALGDVLMCTPAMRVLRDVLPGRSLTLLTSPSGAAAAPFVPEIDEAIVHAAPWMKTEVPAAPEDLLALAATLAARRFDAAVVFTTYTQSALPAATLCWLAGIPLRLAHCRENPYHLLTDWIADPEPQAMVRHEVQRQLELVRHAGAPRQAGPAPGLSFALRAADVTATRVRLLRIGVDPDRPWLLLHPGASAASRRYPASHWARAVGLLARRTGLPIVITGSAAEVELVEEVRAGCGVGSYSLAGQLSLGELGAALHLAAVALTNNSGPAHVAAAVGTPVVDLYALTNPQHTPWRVRSRVLFQDVPCRFCFKSTCPAGHHACLAEVAPERVVDAVLELLPPAPGARLPSTAGADAASLGLNAG
ncbi:lipopolysaccharide heptosyltransferase II [Massilia sp. LXY-6]|uniref:lipopolysaccharide heptosyltransferase II n=1 Tax=Massilia sp. LXY-6 TaxID=3379823 RepID=UPI003EE099AE